MAELPIETILNAGPSRAAARVTRDAWRVVAPVRRSSAVLGLLLAAATWPGSTATLAPQAGLDGSWQAALAMATHLRLHFGTQIIWTYGPLGFLTTRQLYYAPTAMLAWVFRLALATAAFAMLVSAARRYTTLLLSCVVAYVAAYPMVVTWGGEEVLLVLALALTVRLLSRPDDAWRTRWAWITFGIIGGVLLLEKLSLGLGICALAAITVGCAPVRRRVVAGSLILAPLVVVFVVGWFGTGNGFDNLVAYLRGAREATVGYTSMAVDPPALYRDNVQLALVISLAIVALSALYARSLLRTAASARPEAVVPDADPEDRGGPSITRWTASGIVAATSLVTWMLFKEGFVRQDLHRIVFFASIPFILSAFVVGRVDTGTPSRWSRSSASSATLILTVLFASSLVAFAAVGAVPAGILDPVASLRGFSDSFRTLASASRRDAVVDGARAALQRGYAIPAPIIARITGQTVDVDPWEQTVAWAYPAVRWAPLPTLQNYFAYTTTLDRIDVNFLTSFRAPRFILRQPPVAIDARWPAFEGPSTQVAIECNYREVEVGPAWELLERGANRCGAMQELKRVEVAFGQRVSVPTAGHGDMVVATFMLRLPSWWRLLDAVYKPPRIAIDLDGAPLANRFIVATASSVHLIAPAGTLGYTASYSPRRTHSFALISRGSGHATYRVAVTFYKIPMR